MNPNRPEQKYPLRSYRLSSPETYRRVKMEGGVMRKFPLTLRTLQAPDILESRIGFVVRKKSGPAVFRNIIRRILREKFREAKKTFVKPTWVVFEVSDRASEVTRSELRNSTDFLLQPLCTAAA